MRSPFVLKRLKKPINPPEGTQMKLFPSRLAIALVAGFITQASFAADPIATVNGTAIPAARAEAMISEQRAQGAPDTPQLHDAVREELVRREILGQEAGRKGLDKKADVIAQMELARQAILIRSYLQDYVKANPVTDAELKKEYDSIKGRMGDKEYKPRHVLLETEEQAKDVIAKLQAGSKIEDLAKESRDPGSKSVVVISDGAIPACSSLRSPKPWSSSPRARSPPPR